jgi:hypothetical protein
MEQKAGKHLCPQTQSIACEGASGQHNPVAVRAPMDQLDMRKEGVAQERMFES